LETKKFIENYTKFGTCDFALTVECRAKLDVGWMGVNETSFKGLLYAVQSHEV
jgi:hypothetical protein